MATFEEELNTLLDRTKNISVPIMDFSLGGDVDSCIDPSEDWINDVEIFYNKYLTKHALGHRIKSILLHRTVSAYTELVSCLRSISRDQDFINKMNGVSTIESQSIKPKHSQNMMCLYLMPIRISCLLLMNLMNH